MSRPSTRAWDGGPSAGQRSPMEPADARHVVALAVRAPSLHNTQPWVFVLRGGALELRADRSRQLPGTDPEGRQLVISCGAALFGARLGVLVLGYLPQVELMPDPWQPDLLARVRLGGAAPTDPEDVALVNAMALRRSVRTGLVRGDVDEGLFPAVRQAAAAERSVLLGLTDPQRRASAAELLAAADRAQGSSPEVIRELVRWTSRSCDDADGLPSGTWPDVPAATPPEGFAARDFGRRSAGGRPRGTAWSADGGSAAAEATGHPPAAALLTRTDTPVDWLRAGQALHRVLLTAACAGVQASLHSQPFGLLGLRRALQQELTGGAEPQMLLQFGRLDHAQSSAARTPRRPVDDVLVVG